MHNRGTFRRFPRSKMESLCVTAYMQTAIVSELALPLDGILYYFAMAERYGQQGATHPGAEHPDKVTGISLPLARVNEEGPQWFYACSWAQWGPHVDYQSHWVKRFDLDLADLIDTPKRVDVASGRYKLYRMPVYCRHATLVRWYVVGHRESIEDLLALVTGIGKKAAHGWGAIARWTIEPSQDWSVRRGDDLMRAIPAIDGLLIGYRPSYWLPKNQTVCAVPQRGD